MQPFALLCLHLAAFASSSVGSFATAPRKATGLLREPTSNFAHFLPTSPAPFAIDSEPARTENARVVFWTIASTTPSRSVAPSPSRTTTTALAPNPRLRPRHFDELPADTWPATRYLIALGMILALLTDDNVADACGSDDDDDDNNHKIAHDGAQPVARAVIGPAPVEQEPAVVDAEFLSYVLDDGIEAIDDETGRIIVPPGDNAGAALDDPGPALAINSPVEQDSKPLGGTDADQTDPADGEPAWDRLEPLLADIAIASTDEQQALDTDAGDRAALLVPDCALAVGSPIEQDIALVAEQEAAVANDDQGHAAASGARPEPAPDDGKNETIAGDSIAARVRARGPGARMRRCATYYEAPLRHKKRRRKRSRPQGDEAATIGQGDEATTMGQGDEATTIGQGDEVAMTTQGGEARRRLQQVKAVAAMPRRVDAMRRGQQAKAMAAMRRRIEATRRLQDVKNTSRLRLEQGSEAATSPGTGGERQDDELVPKPSDGAGLEACPARTGERSVAAECDNADIAFASEG
ncbi:uncharacterized protein PFL1_00820 [Pseudozyma flocculosa PF-1]|uniref:Uncharacterized protein n=1 Tax=Pseudozyma flocculosa TaxID=84751 RepID=A0A5C3F5N1_9BASI|nr:uncharacterized protein PFL1_00820 [Pseudozyma flocculosa PF-1]EPQ31485.1 hypothetical protein PFL1_00820 [Pseudozyma flocculosa PF-1]SPO38729.1 uncharacterized protein PSFLO_04208 [Pseudozyma flocculosa]